MRIAARFVLAACMAGAVSWPLVAQQTQPAQTAPAKAAAAPTGVAATVNGQPIPEVALQRGLKRVSPDKQAEARPEILDFLIDNVLIEQNLQQRGVNVDQKEIDALIEKIKGEITKQNDTTKQKHTFEEFMKELMLDEAELRA